MEANLIIRYHRNKGEYINGKFHIIQEKFTRRIDSLNLYDICIHCKNNKSSFFIYYDEIEQISDGNVLIKINPSENEYQYLKIRYLIGQLCKFSEKGGDK